MTGTDVAEQRLDRVIDALHRGEPRDDADESILDADESSLAATARLLHKVLPRFHPRFGFEDALTARLARTGSPSGGATEPIPFPVPVASGRGQDARHVWVRYRRELVAGGAIASGVSIAIPLAGAALVRWRRSRSSGTHGGLF
jgi:hypothetical protein